MITFIVFVTTAIILFAIFYPMITGIIKQRNTERREKLVAGLNASMNEIMDGINGETKSHTRVAAALNRILWWQTTLPKDRRFIYDYVKPKLDDALKAAEDQNQRHSQTHIARMFHFLTK